MPLQQTSGNVTQDAYGGGAASLPVYVENVFSTYLYTGNATTSSISTKNIVNNLNILTNGGLVWIKDRSGANNNFLFDTARGSTQSLRSNQTNGNTVLPSSSASMAFNTNGFTVGDSTPFGALNAFPDTYVSWSFVKQPKFFDIVTYTGTGSAHTIAHNLGVAPGCIIVKRTDTTGNWQVYHSGLTSAAYSIQLNLSNAQASATTVWNSTAPTSTVFSVGTDATVNASGGTYVAYIYASNAGGFGLTGTDNVISCGSFTTNSSGAVTVSLGYEPQFVIIKAYSNADDWYTVDNMRGWSQTQFNSLNPDNTTIEQAYSPGIYPTATGFQSITGGSALTPSWSYIYIAIRRGPMAVPTTGTSVFSPVAQTSAGTVTTNFPVDLSISNRRVGSSANSQVIDRLRGSSTTSSATLKTTATDAETINTVGLGFDSNTGYIDNFWSPSNSIVYWNFERAPSFFDVVCYTGTGSATTINHNLGVVPQMIIVKGRSTATNWNTYNATLGNTGYIRIDSNAASGTSTAFWNSTTPTSSVFSLGAAGGVNGSGTTYVAYLFATCPGVSYVGSYTGNGTTQAIACGFTGGARFVLIKRTDSTGDWYVYDTARGMTSVTDPYLLLDSTAAETATLGSVTSTTGGFTVNAAILAAINTSSATYIFLAIA